MIARGDGTPLYNFAVAVDDLEMQITDVIRGDDHLSNTPKQLLVLEALGGEPPRYAHLPLLHGPDGKKLSKRHGAASVQELRAARLPAGRGPQLPRAARLGRRRRPDDPLDRASSSSSSRSSASARSSAVFDERKLRWLNGRYMRELPAERYVEAAAAELERSGHPEAAADRERLAAACAIAQDKAQTLSELWPLIAFLFEPPVEDPKAWSKVMERDGVGRRAAAALEVLRAAEPFDAADARARARRRGGAAADQAARPVPADPGRDHRDHGLAGDFRLARGARPRRRSCERI